MARFAFLLRVRRGFAVLLNIRLPGGYTMLIVIRGENWRDFDD